MRVFQKMDVKTLLSDPAGVDRILFGWLGNVLHEGVSKNGSGNFVLGPRRGPRTPTPPLCACAMAELRSIGYFFGWLGNVLHEDVSKNGSGNFVVGPRRGR